MTRWKVFGYEPGAAWVYPASETVHSDVYGPIRPDGYIGTVMAMFVGWEAHTTLRTLGRYRTRRAAVAAVIAAHEKARAAA